MIWKELYHDFDRAQREIAQWMDTPFQHGSAFPPISIYKNDEGLLLHIDLPGISREELDLSIAGDVVTIAGHIPGAAADRKKGEKENPEGSLTNEVRALRRERFTGEFSRTIELPVEVDSSKAEAVLKDGILSLTLPLREERKPRKINIANA